MSNQEINDLYRRPTRLIKEQWLIKSVIDDCLANQALKSLPKEKLVELINFYEFRRKFRNYIWIKRLIPSSLIAPLTGSELSKMAYAAALNSNTVSLGLIGYSLPAFFFFQMSYYYVYEKLKGFCTVGK